MSIARCRTVVGSLYGLMRNALGLNVATPLESQELSCTVAPDRRLVVLGHEPIAGFARDHGTVANEAAMLALHTLDSTTLLAEPRFVAAGDSCLRADDPGWRWHCISGHGQSLSDWERRPLAGVIASVVAGAQPLDADLTAIAAQGVSAWGLTRLSDSGATAAKDALGIQRADIGDASTAGRALMAVATPGAAKLPQINADASVTLIDVPSGGSSSAGYSIKTGLEAWVVCSTSDEALDVHGSHPCSWTGTPAGAVGLSGRRAFSFDRSNYVRLAHYAGLHDTVRSGFSIAAWFRPSAANGFIFGAAPDSAIRRYYLWHSAAGDSQYWASSLNGAQWDNDLYAPNNGTSAWSFGCIVCDPQSGWLHNYAASGVVYRLALETGTGINPSAGDTDQPLWIGTCADDAGAQNFSGLIDSVGYWRRPLRPEEVAWLYAGGAGRAYSDLT